MLMWLFIYSNFVLWWLKSTRVDLIKTCLFHPFHYTFCTRRVHSSFIKQRSWIFHGLHWKFWTKYSFKSIFCNFKHNEFMSITMETTLTLIVFHFPLNLPLQLLRLKLFVWNKIPMHSRRNIRKFKYMKIKYYPNVLTYLPD